MLKNINLKIDNETLTKFTKACNNQEITKSRVIRFLIRDWIKAPNPKKIPKID